MQIPVLGAEAAVPVPTVPSKHRARLTDLQRKALAALVKNGPMGISWGTRSLQIGPSSMSMKSDGFHALIGSGMVAAAKGNHPYYYFRITPYGEKCLERGYRDDRWSRPFLEVMAHWHAGRDAEHAS